MNRRLGLLATKVGMTQIFTEEGVRLPVTVLQVQPNVVVSKKTDETDGYCAVQLGSHPVREKLVTRPMKGHFAKASVAPVRHLREFRLDDQTLSTLEVGAFVGLEAISEAGSVDVSGISKGKGFAGVMKRHNFGGFPASHGTHEYFRHGGSIGQRAKPGKVMKGKRMPGQMGNERVTVLNLRVALLDAEQGLILVRGAVPGAKGCILEVKPSTRRPNRLPGVSGHVVEESSKNPMKASKASAKGGKK